MSDKKTFSTIAPNEEVICDEALVTGDVEEESIIDTRKLIVEGTTHTSSRQFSKYATIYMHQGTLRCHEAKITLLDGGEIHASSIHVDTAIGGSMYAQDVSIKHLTDNATIYASNSITIEHISGKNNKLFINYKEVPILVSKLDLIQDDIEELSASLHKEKEGNSSLLKEIEVEIKRLQEEIKRIEDSSKTAKITVEKQIKTKNDISFQIDDSNQITFQTQKDKYSSFYLSFNKNTVTLKPTSQTITLNS